MLLPTAALPLALLAPLTLALPSGTLLQRAGAPAQRPIPANCTLSSPLPPINSSTAVYKPSPNLTTLYAFYLSSPPVNLNATITQCQEQCYGYGKAGQDCHTAVWAGNVAIPANYYNIGPGHFGWGCLMYGKLLDEGDFVEVEDEQADGTWEAEGAVGISCPS